MSMKGRSRRRTLHQKFGHSIRRIWNLSWTEVLVLWLVVTLVLPPQPLLATGPTAPNPPTSPPPGGGSCSVKGCDECCAEDDEEARRCAKNGVGWGCGFICTRPLSSQNPVYLRYGTAYETPVDFELWTPIRPWQLTRSYSSGGTGDSAFGNKWLSGVADHYLINKGSNKVALLVDAASQLVFTGSGSPVTYAAPAGNTLRLEHDSTNKEFIVTDTMTDRRDVFHDFTVTTLAERGRLKERSTRAWHSQSKAGFSYSYNSNGTVNQITTPTGQDYNIVYTYSSSRITKVEIKDDSNPAVLLGQVDYTYYDDVTSPSTDLGSSGDLVQVKVSRRATADTAGSLSIVRYTQYRYDTSSRLKAVYEHDAIQRIIDQLGVTDEADLLTEDDDFGTPDVEEFANRRFTYYPLNASTSSANTPFATGENLNSTYGGSEVSESGYVKTETIRQGCGSCGATSGITKTYFYMGISQGATLDQNEVTRLVIEDTEDADGNAHSRRVYGLNDTGRQLRDAFIDDPTGTPTYWCESWKMATTGKPDRIGEHRMPSAHDVASASELRDFLDPYDSETNSWAKDTGTLHASSGLTHVYGYNSDGARTDEQVKQGRTGTAYYTAAYDYGDGDGDSSGDDYDNNVLMVASYAYPTQTTTRTSGEKTSYSYTFYDTDDREVKTKTTTLPVVSTGQNGSGTATTTTKYYDKLGRLRWMQDGEGYVHYYAQHPVWGQQAFEVTDVDPVSPGTAVTGGSSGEWDAWTVGDANSNKPSRSGLPTALALTTKTYIDDIGRPNRTVQPGGDEHYIVYENTRTLTLPYWDGTSGETLLPIQVTELSLDETNIGESYEVEARYSGVAHSSGVPTGFSTEPTQSDYVSWTRHTRDDITGTLKYTDQYHDIPSSGTGTLSTNFYRTVTQTDALGRTDYTIQVVSGSSAGDRKEQVTQRVYDIRDRVTAVKQGVSGDTAANSHNMTDSYNTYPTMRTLSETVYDDGGVGDGHETQVRRYHGTGTNDFTGVNYHRTYRGHVRGMEPFYMNGSTETAAGPVRVNDINWQGQTTASGQYTSSPTWATVLTGDGYTDYTTTATNRRALTKNSYDDLGRLYRTDVHAIDQSNGALSHSLRTDTFYDRRGNVVASGDLLGGTATEVAYDGAGRQYQSRTVLQLESTKYSSGAFNYRDPQPDPSMSSMSGGDDQVITLSHSVFDEAGNVTEQHAFDMNHDDTGGTLGMDLSNDDDYVRRTVYSWYDDADRLTTEADYGSGDTTAGAGLWKYAAVPTRGSAPTASSNTKLVTLYAYDEETGRQSVMTDPAGIETKTFYDDLGRTIWVAENFDNFDPGTLSTISDGSDDSKDRVTKTEYDGLSNTTKLIAYNGSSSNAQATLYLYEESVSASLVTNTIFPDSSDTTSSGTDQVEITYNIDGSTATRTDQRGTVIAFSYDNLRRLQSQKVTTLGGSTDGAIRSITRKYDSMGRVAKITSHGNQTDDPDDTTDIENQIVYTYNGLQRVQVAAQSHQGAVTGSTPEVAYGLDDAQTGGVYTNSARPYYLGYPSGRVLHYDYGTADGLEDRQSTPRRLRETDGSGTVWVEYSHTGGGMTVITDYQQPDLKLDLFGGTSSTYFGLDRFGRTIDHRWYDYTSGTVDRARYQYGYDYASNHIWKEDPVADAATVDLDDLSTFDGLHRLKAIDRGELNGTKDAISTLVFAQDFVLDQLNNWATFTEDDDGDATDELDQDRTHNDANEITDITETTGPSWVTPAHDAAGNMTTIPQPAAPTSSYTLTWDAWNRLVKIADGANTVAEHEYDGKNRRIVKSVYVAGSHDHDEHYYLSQDNQVLEVRLDSATTPHKQFTWGTRYVDDLGLRTRDTDSNGSLDETLYALQDANWNITALSDTSGTIVERFKYDSYGHSTVLDANFSADSDNASDHAWTYRFTSREFDPETKLHYFRARYYHGGLGRFTGRDPASYAEGASLYAAYYVPNGLDPSGLQFQQTSTIGKPAGSGKSTVKQSSTILSAMKADLMKCCDKYSKKSCPPPPNSPSCEDSVKAIIDSMIQIRRDIRKAGGPILGIPGRRGLNCSACEGRVGMSLPTSPYFRYDTVLNMGLLTHTWGQLRCGADGSVIGSIDFWKSFNSPYASGKDSFGWSGENHDDLDQDFWDACSTGAVHCPPR